MRIFLFSVVFGLVVVMSTFPHVIHAQVNTNDEAYREYLLQIIALLQEQVAALRDEQSRSGTFSSFLLTDEGDVAARYATANRRSIAGIANQNHREYIERFFALTPEPFDTYVREVVVFDGTHEFDAFVETIPPYRDDTWRFGLHADMLEYDVEAPETTELLVHETAHLISYDAVPGVVEPARVTCHSYFTDFGCPPVSSYLQAFINEFWTDRLLTTLKRDGSLEERYDANTLAETFVSDYAATAPGEDFAESFATFVLTNEPTGNLVKDEKVRSFYAYPELVSWRAEIRSAL